jgi:hypothetical protein
LETAENQYQCSADSVSRTQCTHKKGVLDNIDYWCMEVQISNKSTFKYKPELFYTSGKIWSLTFFAEYICNWLSWKCFWGYVQNMFFFPLWNKHSLVPNCYGCPNVLNVRSGRKWLTGMSISNLVPKVTIVCTLFSQQ